MWSEPFIVKLPSGKEVQSIPVTDKVVLYYNNNLWNTVLVNAPLCNQSLRGFYGVSNSKHCGMNIPSKF